jgi:DNA ligase-1
VLLAQVVEVSTAIAATASRTAKLARIAATLRALDADEHAIGARMLAGEQPHKAGVGYGLASSVVADPAPQPSLTLREVDARFAAMVDLRGEGSGTARRDAVGELLRRATAPEQAFLRALAIGNVRQGAEASLVVDAIARATELPLADTRRAYMLAGDLGAVADAALADGAAGLARFGLVLFRPILPMLAQTADDAGGALALFDGAEAAFELKLDGFRIQLHKDGDDIRAYSRNLNDVTAAVPEAVAAARAMPAHQLILDGEAVALGPDGRGRPFQDTMKRFGRRADAALRAEMPLSLAMFDVLRVDGRTLLDASARDRFATLAALSPAHAVPRVVTRDPAVAAAFYDDAIARGHEGVMAKSLDAPYDAGHRGAAWLKIKKVRRLDLVILAAEWGSGRRTGWLSNLWLGARDPAAPGEFVMLGKTFKGLTDEVLTWQTAELLAREVDRDGHVVHVRPELVAEIAFNDVLRSPRYPGGLALRLARMVRYRGDKTAAEADTIDAVRAIAIADGVLAADGKRS